jgi:hypothetical protein
MQFSSRQHPTIPRQSGLFLGHEIGHSHRQRPFRVSPSSASISTSRTMARPSAHSTDETDVAVGTCR